MCLLVEALIAAWHVALIPLSGLLARFVLIVLGSELAVAPIEFDGDSPYLTSLLWLWVV